MTDATSKLDSDDLISYLKRFADSINTEHPLERDLILELSARYLLLSTLAEFLALEHIEAISKNTFTKEEALTPKKINADTAPTPENSDKFNAIIIKLFNDKH